MLFTPQRCRPCTPPALPTPERKLQQLAKIPLIVIDDFGLRPLRTPQDEDLHDLIAERYERASTIVTSNLDVDEWPAAFPNKLLAAATIDRLRDGAYRVILDGETRRRLRPDPAAPAGVNARTTKRTTNARSAA